MHPIFGRGPSLQIRLAVAIFLSLVLMISDHYFKQFDTAKVYLNSLVSPIQYLAEAPKAWFDWALDRSRRKGELRAENQLLKKNQLLLAEQLQQLHFLKQENNRLRGLLSSPIRQDARKMVAEVMSVDSNRYSLQLLINKGSLHGVYEGQAVLAEKGVVGQVLDVGSTNSRVLLITDNTHAIPVRVARNDVRSIAIGNGDLDTLLLQHVAHSIDIKQGDLLQTSGLGGVYPEGYPVAKVTKVISDESRPFAYIEATPIVKLDRIRYLLLLWPQDSEKDPVYQPIDLLKDDDA